ncbi:MAG: TIGR02996 domain-containing protein [Gemmataceae bacterium]
MTDETAFLRTILDRPLDDAPRLVYADWLEECGDTARAEFIRVQVELAQLPADDPRRSELAARERELLHRHERDWVAALGDWVREWRFSRGLIEYVRVQAADFVDRGGVLLEKAAVWHARLCDATNRIAAVADSPVLPRLRALDLGFNSLTAERLEPLFRSPAVANLESLDLGRNDQLRDAGAAALAAAPFLRGLRTLRLYRCGLSGAGAASLFAGRWPNLVELDLENNHRVGPAGAAAIARSRAARRLRRLHLQVNGVGGEGAQSLANSRHLANLTVLNLFGNRIGDDGAAALANSPALAALEDLDLGSNNIGTAGARALASSRHLADLRRLNLNGNKLSRTDVRMLQRRFGGQVVCIAVAATG